MIFGFPGEGQAERRESVRMVMNICRKYPGAEFWTNIFTPLSGACNRRSCSARSSLGSMVPQTLEGCGLGFLPALYRSAFAWAKAEKHEEVQTMREYDA